ncbi:isoaspartyl peptidase/L-asparaginase [Schlegelella sp. S2-27]|uniref:Isoaspartyl peptidase/L-asparaginase n=1 Tax=Caldimonas mangrovi TaxID=2944811 RepID=A0ABT0YJ89_9BURK|nr:isoaspartyl peptidase/L-asparaginase [Caldimonas mangrovi]MCM5678789.1 isoaspartyl peptidase/L-asparaginase [Caldimonas mangrovi]
MQINAPAAIVVHGGSGSPSAWRDGCERAAQRALGRLQAGGTALDAAVEAVTEMEDDGRYNAGSGSILCLDGYTVETDAGVMDNRGRLGAVACLQGIKNPVLVAQAVTQTPHWLIAGDGARRFAEVCGFEESLGTGEAAKRYHAQLLRAFDDPSQADPDDREGAAKAAVFKRFWNYTMPWDEAMKRHGNGTVGAVVRAADGDFAVATSTGGSAPSLLGRVGDTPIVGCGYYAGDHGAIAATGVGEYIARQMLARTVYDWVAQGMPLQQALNQGVARLPKEISVGLIGVTRDGAGASSNRDMAAHVLV